MRKIINVPPPQDFSSFSPSELFRFFFQIGHWTEDSFSDEFQAYTRGKLVSTVTISKWKNQDVIPTRYSGPFFKLIENRVETSLARNWVTAFETVWALHSARRAIKAPQGEMQSFSNPIRSQHSKWIQHQYSKKRFGEVFSPSDIYVPLQVREISGFADSPQSVENIIDLTIETDKNTSDIDWIFISGDPGSGKSMTALRMAYSMCEEDIFPIYLRGSRLSNIDIDINDPKKLIGDAFSIKSFLEYFRASSFKTACLILDGLDEIGRAELGPSTALNQIISELKIEQAACTAHGKNLHVIAFGRDAHVQYAAHQACSDKIRQFEMLSLDGSPRSNDDKEYIQGHDLRATWWAKYLVATGNIIDPSLPDFLSFEYADFSDFGSDPLLTYLICHSALENHSENPHTGLPHERVNKFTYTSNKNIIYKTIFERLALNIKNKLTPRRFLSVLQYIALAVWHNDDGRSTSLKRVNNYVEDSDVKTSLAALNLSDTSTLTPPDILITSFYYRIKKDEKKSDKSVIEFTHKTFSEYLISTLLFDRFTSLISAFENQSRFEDALENWAKVSCAGSHHPSLTDFCQKEASLRFENLSHLDWDSALTICRSHIDGRLFDGIGLSSIKQIQRSSSLLFFIWSCLNLERQKRTGKAFKFHENAQKFNPTALKSLQSPNTLNPKSSSRIEPTLQNQTLLTPSLSATHLKSADMRQLSLSLGHIESPICEDVSFAMTHWSHVKVTAASFIRSVFQQAIFHQWRVTDTDFSHCFFQGSRFQGATISACRLTDTFFSQCHFSDVEFISSHLESVVFDRCIFTQCDFSKTYDTNDPFNAQFRHCTFIDMETALRNMPAENIKNIIPQNSNTEKPHSKFKKYEFEKSLDKLL